MTATRASLRDRDTDTDTDFKPTFITRVGEVTSQGDRALRADEARSEFDVDGTGITIGLLSDSYDNLGGAADDVVSGDLPEGVTVLRDLLSTDEAFRGADEGRAMLQLIHDVAPGADLIFRTASVDAADFADGIDALVAAGADIIVDDIGYFDQPFFQDGIIAQAADRAVAAGVAFFSAAGNAGKKSYESSFNPGTTYEEGDFLINISGDNEGPDSFKGGTAHEFTPGNEFQEFTLGPDDKIDLSFQWDDPFKSVSGGDGSTRDLDIYVFNEGRTEVVGGSATPNLGEDAVELFSFTNTTEETQTFNLMIVHEKSVGDDADPEKIKYIDFGSGANFTEQSLINSSTSFGHPNAAGVAGVGAANFSQTPEFGVNPPELEDFSSLGGTPILFDTEGNRLPTPEIRNQPLFVAPDGTSTTVPDFEAFEGTSAAAPHAAAVAALMLEAAGGPDSLTPQQIYSVLSETAIDMETLGFDLLTGFGLIDALAAVTAINNDVMPDNPFSLDIDGNGVIDALTDGSLLLRYEFGFRGNVLIDGAIGSGAQRADAQSIEGYLEGAIAQRDFDGNGSIDALTDGIMALRFMFGFRGLDVVNGLLGNDATRNGNQIEELLQSYNII